jgi:hypothetical protein
MGKNKILILWRSRIRKRRMRKWKNGFMENNISGNESGMGVKV